MQLAMDLSECAAQPKAGTPGFVLVEQDVLCTEGMRTTCGSRILENFIPPYDATSVKKLKEAGAVLVGKVSMDEFAMGSTSENCAFGPPRNPWNTDYICGGSSGGSAASVAAISPCTNIAPVAASASAASVAARSP